MSESSWRAESDGVLRSPTKRELQERERKVGLLGQRRPRSNVFIAGVVGCVALVILVVVLVPALVTQLAVRSSRHQEPLSAAYCEQLPEKPRRLCLQYQQAQGAAKFAAAAQWKQASPATYVCAGIDAECLNSDLQSSASGSACQVLAAGSQCGQSQQQLTCQAGFCGGPTAETTTAETATFHAPTAPAGSTPAGRSDEADDTVAASDIMLLRMPAVPAAPNASWPTAVASVWPSNTGIRVPETFLATSHEWRRIKDYAGDNLQAWANIFSMLSDSPVIRIGGASQDAMTEAPGADVWEALVRLQKATNARYIIGLPLWQKNAQEMSKQIMEDAHSHLGNSLIGFELGNEPEFWPTGLGGYDEEGKWVPGFEAFASYFHRTALALNPCIPGKATNKPLLSGPGWGNVNTQDPSWFAKVVHQGADCYFWESNTHYYPYINNETVTSQELLSQWLQDFAVDKFKAYAEISKKAGLDIRISEANSMYGGGRVNLSETMAGTLWTIDALYAFAAAGARAFHLHWGKGGEPNGDAPPSVGVQTNFDFKVPPGRAPLPWPSVHAPWYAYLMWTTAVAGGYGQAVDATLVAASFDKLDSCTANLKVWAVRSDDGEVRITLLNKDHDKSCNVEVRLEPKFCSNTATFARLLPGKRGMDSKAGLTWQGQHYVGAATTGIIQGDLEVEEVKPAVMVAGKSCSFKVSMPKISGALLVVSSERNKPAV